MIGAFINTPTFHARVEFDELTGTYLGTFVKNSGQQDVDIYVGGQYPTYSRQTHQPI